jgi:hypothetical protein
MAWRRVAYLSSRWACGFIPRHPTPLSPTQLQTSILKPRPGYAVNSTDCSSFGH